MDNITHSLAGIALAETFFYANKKNRAEKKHRGIYWLVSIAANNFPDLDLFLVGLTPGRLGSLLHHRGHTHTLGGAVIQLGLMAAVFFFVRRTIPRFASLTLLAFFGLLLHVAMDGMNSYGIHPLWPFNSHWFYGDFIFIVEPWIWLTLIAPLLFNPPIAWQRWLGVVILGLGFGLAWFSRMIPFPIAFLFTLCLLALWALRARLNYRTAIVSTFAVLAIFGFSSWRARHEISKNFSTRFGARLVDIALSPMPMNPFCWRGTTIEDAGSEIASRNIYLSLAPRVIAARQCAPGLMREVNEVDAAHSDEQIQTHLPWTMNRQAAERWIAASASVAAFLKFSRIPHFELSSGKVLAQDLRFVSAIRNGFSSIEFEMDRNSSRLKNIPPWIPPRTELFESTLRNNEKL